MPDWQPISNAKAAGVLDGRALLLSIPDVDRGLWGVEVGQWHGGDEDWAGWWTNGGPNAGSDMHGWSRATHWMPLPPPPEETDVFEEIEDA